MSLVISPLTELAKKRDVSPSMRSAIKTPSITKEKYRAIRNTAANDPRSERIKIAIPSPEQERNNPFLDLAARATEATRAGEYKIPKNQSRLDTIMIWIGR